MSDMVGVWANFGYCLLLTFAVFLIDVLLKLLGFAGLEPDEEEI